MCLHFTLQILSETFAGLRTLGPDNCAEAHLSPLHFRRLLAED